MAIATSTSVSNEAEHFRCLSGGRGALRGLLRLHEAALAIRDQQFPKAYGGAGRMHQRSSTMYTRLHDVLAGDTNATIRQDRGEHNIEDKQFSRQLPG